MFRWIVTAALVAIAIVNVSFASTAAASEFRDGASLVSGLVGWTNHESQQSFNRIDGGSWSLDYSRIGGDAHWTAGFLVRHFGSDEKFVKEGSGQETSVDTNRLVAAVQGQYLIGSGRIRPYIGALAGVHMQTSEVFVDGAEDRRESSHTFTTGFSAGSYFHLSEGILVRVEYTFHYFADSFTIKNNHMHGVYGGLGFQFGGQ